MVSTRRFDHRYSIVVCTVWVAVCVSVLPACGQISSISESTLIAIRNSPPLENGPRFFAFTLNKRPFALLSYSVSSQGQRLCVDRSFKMSLNNSQESCSVEYDASTLNLVSYQKTIPQDDYRATEQHEIPVTELASCVLRAIRQDEEIQFTWGQQGGTDTHAMKVPQRVFALDLNKLGAEGLEFAGRCIDWGSSQEQTAFMLDPTFVSNSLTRALVVMQASVRVVGRQEIWVGRERYSAAVADIVVPLVRFRCWYDSTTLDLLRWEIVGMGITAVRVDGEDIALSVPDERALAAIMSDNATQRYLLRLNPVDILMLGALV